jgi:chemotaxis protein methyltransferase CheR
MDPRAFSRIQRLVYERTAVVLDDTKEYLVESRLATIASEHGYHSVDDLCLALSEQRHTLLAEVVEAMTTNETSFFRDHHPFEALRRSILPDLIEKRARERILRIWCAACSSGQEPYSVAMLIDEHFPQLASWSLRIFATDISKAVLARGKQARFRQIEVNRGLAANMLVKYFTRDGLDWELRPSIKRMVTFAEMNLVGPWPAMESYDLILLRNVLIYFDQTTKVTTLNRVRQQMRADGYLMLGGAETTPSEVTYFERLSIPRAGLYRAVTAGQPSQGNLCSTTSS